jgi:hypothetical protein
VKFAQAGEMDGSVFLYPEPWIRTTRALRARLLQNSSMLQLANVDIGVSTNFNKLCGRVNLDIGDTTTYLKMFPRGWAKVKAVRRSNLLSQQFKHNNS